MQIAGLIKMTLLDYPGKLACTIFTPGCQLRCPYCHNSQLALANSNGPNELSVPDILGFLRKRAGFLEGICISGGEPLLQNGIEEFILAVKSLGYYVKLDTNGGFPKLLARLLGLGLLDYIAMDIKNCPSHYAETCGKAEIDLSPFEESIRLIQQSGIPHEFRTTVVREFHSEYDMLHLNEWRIDSSPFFMQSFQDSGHLLKPGLHGYSTEEMEEMRKSILPCIPNASLRGVAV